MKLLAVIDMQNDFINGALGTREAEFIVSNSAAMIDKFLTNGDMVVYTRDTHAEDYFHTQEGKNLPVKHCIKNTFGWEISEKIYKKGCTVIDKPSFGSLELAEWVAKIEELEEIVLIGLCTDICVISNAMVLKARLPEVPITVVADCCAGVAPQSHQNALEAMKMCQIRVL